MARPKKKDSTSITLRLDTEIYNRLDKFSDESGQPKVVAVERALNAYLDDYYEKQALIAQVEKK